MKKFSNKEYDINPKEFKRNQSIDEELAILESHAGVNFTEFLINMTPKVDDDDFITGKATSFLKKLH